MPNIDSCTALVRLRNFTNGRYVNDAYVESVLVDANTWVKPATPRHVVVIGAGISGLAAAEALQRLGQHLRVTIIEATERSGGVISSERVDGFVLEHGPDVALKTKPAAIELAHRIGIGESVVATNAAGAFVATESGLRRLPAGTNGIVARNLAALRNADILTPAGFLRAALEPFIQAREDDVDESLESFAVRRVGREAYQRITEPLLTGIVAGDGAKLSMTSMFPHLRAMERQSGSVSLAMRQQRTLVKPSGSPFITFRNGMSELPEAITAYLKRTDGVTFRFAAPASAIIRHAGATEVKLASGERIVCDAVIVATPAGVTALLLRDVSAAASKEISGIKHVSTAVVTLAYHATDVMHPLDGTGYVIPRHFQREALACTWSSSKIDHRAPRDMKLLRVFLGGAPRPALPAESDAQLTTLARRELVQELGISAEPRLVRVARWTNTMPQYQVGHAVRMCRLDQALEPIPWLAVAGNAYRGVGIPDCIASGVRAAERVLESLASV